MNTRRISFCYTALHNRESYRTQFNLIELLFAFLSLRCTFVAGWNRFIDFNDVCCALSGGFSHNEIIVGDDDVNAANQAQ